MLLLNKCNGLSLYQGWGLSEKQGGTSPHPGGRLTLKGTSSIQAVVKRCEKELGLENERICENTEVGHLTQPVVTKSLPTLRKGVQKESDGLMDDKDDSSCWSV